MSKHTRTPWTIYETDCGEWRIVGEGMVIARCSTRAPGDPEQEANARLIVRAVNSHADLLSALKGLVKVNEDWNRSVEEVTGRYPNWTDNYLDAARAAIAKAKAES